MFNHKSLLISIKPEFSAKIFKGEKKIELRKGKPKLNPGGVILIYSTAPEKALVGYCFLKEIIEDHPDVIWANYRSLLGIDKDRYAEYYKGSIRAIGLVISMPQLFASPIPLATIRNNDPKFLPPQTFKYFESMKDLSKTLGVSILNQQLKIPLDV